MKKQTRITVILLTMFVTSFCSFVKIPIQQTKATYVEGPITQNTLWTLTDSPYVLSNDVTVYPSATLTVEPNVEIRFGSGFSLIVQGQLFADGSEDKRIRFTSNMLQPEPGDWGNIRFIGSGMSSLTYCIMEYGTNGTAVENGSLTLQNNIMRQNSENSITVTNGYAYVEQNNIENNTGNGIYIAGLSQVMVRQNNMTNNIDGITIAGTLASAANIQQNEFTLNSHSGIYLTVEDCTNILITNNNFSQNSYGLCLSTNASTSLRHNQIENNTCGIFYEKGSQHEIHFNNIIENEAGIDCALNAKVNATQNYWGHKSGPHHESLNPHGKGNTVGGNGTNIDFIFFLTAQFDYENESPTVVLWTDKLLVAPNQNVMLIGTNSHDEGNVDQYYFDFGDGTNSGWTTLSMRNHVYSSAGTYVASLIVADDFNQINTNTAHVTIDVQNLESLNVALTVSDTIVDHDENVSLTVHVSNANGAVENANIMLLTVLGGYFTPVSGFTDSSGELTAVFTAPSVTELADVEIFARASKAGYADGSDFEYIRILPPLNVNVAAEPQNVLSEEITTITINVSNNQNEPIEGATITLEYDFNGAILVKTGITDVNGTVTQTLTAPQTLTSTTLMINVTAKMPNYADSFGQTTLNVEPKVLTLEVNADPTAIMSENISTITAKVTHNSIPIEGATITATSSQGGNFSTKEETTNSDGIITLVFAAPQITTHENAQTIITVIANKIGYATAETQTTITIMPKTLVIEVAAKTNTTVSEATTNITVHVAYLNDMSPVPETNVTVSSDNGGIFSPVTGLTDDEGDVTFAFTAPQINTSTPIDVHITISASKTGYAEGHNTTTLTVNQGNLAVQIQASTQPIRSGETSPVNIYVTCNQRPVSDVLLNISADNANFTASTGITDTNGLCTFFFNVPYVREQAFYTVTVNASKNGYINAQQQTMLTVIPTAAGADTWSWMIVLLIVISVLVVAVVVVLIKLKVLSVSFGEESNI